MKKRGFTLVELLSVIIVLGIISVITVPIISNTVNESRMKSFQDTAFGILNTAKQTYLDYAGSKMRVNMSDFKIIIYEGETAIPTSKKMTYSGEAPKNGYVEISADGEATVILYNESYCAYKIDEKEHIKVIEIDSASECDINALKNLEG